jgi:septal ring factor EnvC (AmiA/AmiB activator)
MQLPPHRRALLWAACAVGVFALAPPVGAEREAERLAQIRAEIEEREEQARAFADEADGYLGELEAIDRELVETRRSLTELERHRRRARADLRATKKRLQSAEVDLRRMRVDIDRRLVALYKFRSTGGFAALYSAVDFQTVARRGVALGLVLESDAELFAGYRRLSGELETERATRAALVDELNAAGREVAQREEAVRGKLVERKNLVALLRSRAARERLAADELRIAAQRLEDTLGSLPKNFLISPGLGLSKGSVPRPVQGDTRLGFGRQRDPEFGTETLRTGIEIAAERGTPVRAVARGRVLFAGWLRGYGQMVIIDHGHSSVTVSGYLNDVSVAADQSVERGEIVGTVGDTGSLSAPGLYFEIREVGKPVDPTSWFE